MIDDPKGLMKLKFKCPVCGGEYFGTSCAGTPNAIGHCHSILADGSWCRFNWPRSESEDAKYFIPK